MRRKDKQITDRAVMESVFETAQVIHLGLVDGAEPYVVPMNFGAEGGALFMHSAREGRKIEVLRKNPRVAFSVEIAGEVVQGDVVPGERERPCNFSFRYRSVMGMGRIAFVEDPDEKRRGLNAIMRKCTGRDWEFTEKDLATVFVLRLDVESLAGKQSKM